MTNLLKRHMHIDISQPHPHIVVSTRYQIRYTTSENSLLSKYGPLCRYIQHHKTVCFQSMVYSAGGKWLSARVLSSCYPYVPLPASTFWGILLGQEQLSLLCFTSQLPSPASYRGLPHTCRQIHGSSSDKIIPQNGAPACSQSPVSMTTPWTPTWYSSPSQLPLWSLHNTSLATLTSSNHSVLSYTNLFHSCKTIHAFLTDEKPDIPEA